MPLLQTTFLNDCDREPDLRWDGKNLAKMLTPCLQSQNLWKHDGAVASMRHGVSQAKVKWRSIAEMVPDEFLFTEHG